MSHARSPSQYPRRWPRHAALTLLISLSLMAPTSAAAAKPPPAADPAVITTWNQVMVATITQMPPNGAGKANAEAFLWYSFVQAAVYNAVNGITREYELYNWNAKGPKKASPEAAAAAAAHRVLMTYFGTTPEIVASLNGALATSLAGIPDGRSKRQGIHYGQRAADRIIALRADDGRFAPVIYEAAPAPGVWRPTPPANLPFFDPWLGFVDPLVLDSPTRFDPGPPPAIASDLYVTEFEEVRDYGVKDGSLRSPAQTLTALFISDIPIVPIQASLRDLVTRRGLDISDSARLFAAVEMSIADSIVTTWNAKFVYRWWRPITAIQLADDDGNPATTGVPGWTPFLVTPPYAEWPSGLCSVIGAVTTALPRLNGDGLVDLNITSVAAGMGGPPVTRHYDAAGALQQDCIDARVWSGIHFRTADVKAVAIGTQVANWALDHQFAPTH